MAAPGITENSQAPVVFTTEGYRLAVMPMFVKETAPQAEVAATSQGAPKAEAQTPTEAATPVDGRLEPVAVA